MFAVGIFEGAQDLAQSAAEGVEQSVRNSDAYEQMQQQNEVIQQIDQWVYLSESS